MADLWREEAGSLARKIGQCKVSSMDVIEEHLAHSEAVNPDVNAIVKVLADQARDAAAEADRGIARGEPLGLLHGMAIATAAKQIIVDCMEVVVAGGVESISMVQTPHCGSSPIQACLL